MYNAYISLIHLYYYKRLMEYFAIKLIEDKI